MKTTGKNKIDTVFVLIIFSVFALSVLMVLMLGARVYKKATDITSEAQSDRTLLSYMWTKVKNGDKSGSVSAGEFYGIPALCFDEVISGTQYRTVIYQYDGWVYELFSEYSLFTETDPEQQFKPVDGVRVMRIDDLSVEEAAYGLIKVTSGGRSLLLSPRSENVVASDPVIIEGGLD